MNYCLDLIIHSFKYTFFTIAIFIDGWLTQNLPRKVLIFIIFFYFAGELSAYLHHVFLQAIDVIFPKACRSLARNRHTSAKPHG